MVESLKSGEILGRRWREHVEMAGGMKGLLDALARSVPEHTATVGDFYCDLFEVTNGRELLIYEVSVVAAQTLNIAGTELAAWKLRFEGMQRGRQGKLEAAHRPVYVWLSRAAGHVPLRVESRHPIGRFRVELKQGPALDQVARAGF